MPCSPGRSPVRRLVRADAVVDGKTVRATSFFPPDWERNLAWPARPERFAAPRPSTTKTIALVAGANQSERPSRAADICGTTPVRLRARGGSAGRLRDIGARLAY